jgi:LysM repeat protein
MARAIPSSTPSPDRARSGSTRRAGPETPVRAASRSSAPAARAKLVKYQTLPAGIAKKVTVRQGDNLSVIAKRNRVTLPVLLSANERLSTNGRKPALVYKGDEVLIPKSSSGWGQGPGPLPDAPPQTRPGRPPSGQRPQGGPGSPVQTAPRPPGGAAFSGNSATSEQLAAAYDSFDPVVFAGTERLPETKEERLALVKTLQRELGVKGPSERLSDAQLNALFERVGAKMGIRPAFLHYMANAESGHHQTANTASAHGIMQIERSAHPDAYKGTLNVGNDTVTNVVYGALLRAQTDRTMRKRFKEAGLNPPTRAAVVEFLGDLAYSRGPGLLKHVARYAKEQGIDVNRFEEYVGGRGGQFEVKNGRVRVFPGRGTGIAQTGAGSVLASALADVDRQQPVRLSSSHQDRNSDGRISHLDIWVTRGMKYIDFLHETAAQAAPSQYAPASG